MSNCKICDIHKELYRGDHEFNSWIIREAEKDKNCPGYYYVESKFHKESYGEFSIFDWEELGRAIHQITQKILTEYKPLKIYTISISEAVPHLHFHIVPRYKENSKGIEYLEKALGGKLPKDFPF